MAPIMTGVFLAAPVGAFLLLAAHFFRAGNAIALAISVLAIVLIFVRRVWAARTLQVLLVLGSLEWLRSAVLLIHSRSQMGQPSGRLALILAVVFLLTALSALVFQTRRLKAYFLLGGHARPGEDGDRA